ncbi:MULTISPECIES: JmjC domain-containing protein [unclassified Acinetobacter]|uniref:JmjC domain-containing protein n=1 Tax=unclassified Acinetobacter TaxID=196816 RepID=UPI0035B83CBF
MSKHTTPLAVLGGLTAEQFLTEYWQKKPLLVRNALPQLANMFEPDDILELAQEPEITARLITQTGEQGEIWQVKNSPLSKKDFKKLPEQWTLLVQAVDHYSLDLAQLWKQFDFIPQWRRDDIMVSYAPKGGSVGKHFDFYDVFLVQGYGERRWQLGQWCDENTASVANQPLKLLPDMDVDFDEVLQPGDLLYVPPRLSHYGVAENECLTFSFGFRMPNAAQLIDHVSDRFADQSHFKTPIIDISRRPSQSTALISGEEFAYLKQQLLDALQQDTQFEMAVMALASEAKYPDNIPENEEISLEELREDFSDDSQILLEPASRLLYRQSAQAELLEFWANGECLCIDDASQQLFKQLADGEIITLAQLLQYDENIIADVLMAINQSILMLLEAE